MLSFITNLFKVATKKPKTVATGVTTAGAVALAVVGLGPDEGLRTTAYLDVVGIPTVCFGETRGVSLGDTYTVAECEAMLMVRAQEFEDRIKPCIANYNKLPVEVRASLIRLSYNIGTGAFCGSTIVKKLNRGDIRGACNGFPAWKYAGGKVIRGLQLRREREKKQCLSGLE